MADKAETINQTTKFNFPSGMLTEEQLGLILNALPVEITFADENHIIRYFNETNSQAFPRNREAIGRAVPEVHPPKSAALVNQILDDFKAGRKDQADFWITMRGRMVYIRFLALRDTENLYRGCLEVVQDITELQNLEGEKRLL
jgi:PAS domain S-box-containing protein